MDYEQKYKEMKARVLEMGRGYVKGLDYSKPRQIAEYIDPELKEESEGEKIRKELLQIAKESEDSFYMVITPEKREKLIAWLEKQVERKPIEEVDGEDYGIDGLYHAQTILEQTLGNVEGYQSDDGILEHKCAISAVKKLYERKPAEWSEEDSYMLAQAIKCVNNSGKLDVSTEEIEYWLENLKPQPKQEWKQENTDDLTNFENAMMHIGSSFFGDNAGLDPNDTNTIKEQANLLLELVQKQEWSEEDEKTLADACIMLDWYKGNNWWKAQYIKLWLNSLKERVHLQPKQEWSEEDEKTIHLACELIRHHSKPMDSIGGIDCSILIERLKSLRPQKQWKPSNDEMEALEMATDALKIYPSYVPLVSLCSELKQL